MIEFGQQEIALIPLRQDALAPIMILKTRTEGAYAESSSPIVFAGIDGSCTQGFSVDWLEGRFGLGDLLVNAGAPRKKGEMTRCPLNSDQVSRGEQDTEAATSAPWNAYRAPSR